MQGKSDDRNLVLRAQSGERAAFDVLVERYRERVLRVSLRYTRNRADAEDAVQETFIKAYSGLSRFRGDSAFYTWLHCIAINSAKTTLMAKRRESRLFIAERVNTDGTMNTARVMLDGDTPEELALSDEIGGAVNAAIESLSEEQRTAIVLREFRGFSYSQMACAMSCPVGTVRSRVSRARDAVESRLRGIFADGIGRRRLKMPARAWLRQAEAVPV